MEDCQTLYGEMPIVRCQFLRLDSAKYRLKKPQSDAECLNRPKKALESIFINDLSKTMRLCGYDCTVFVISCSMGQQRRKQS